MSNPPLNPAQTDPLAETDADGNPLDEDAKLDIALEGSMSTSEPPQMSEPKTGAEEKAEKNAGH
jgi:hypothetical protein